VEDIAIMNLMTSWCVLHKSNSSDDDFSMNPVVMMTISPLNLTAATTISP
jgi:hypothetical protein